MLVLEFHFRWCEVQVGRVSRFWQIEIRLISHHWNILERSQGESKEVCVWPSKQSACNEQTQWVSNRVSIHCRQASNQSISHSVYHNCRLKTHLCKKKQTNKQIVTLKNPRQSYQNSIQAAGDQKYCSPANSVGIGQKQREKVTAIELRDNLFVCFF